MVRGRCVPLLLLTKRELHRPAVACALQRAPVHARAYACRRAVADALCVCVCVPRTLPVRPTDQVSSRHLEVTWTDGSWFALDLGSTNGTKLNESQVRMMEGARAAAVACVQCAPTQPTASTCARCCCCCCLNTDQRYKLRDGDQLFIGTDTVLQVQIQASVLVLHSAAHPTAP